MKTWVSWFLFSLAFIYNILDVYQTKMLLSCGAIEINPLMNYMIKLHGIDSLYGVKIVLFLCLAMFMYTHQIRFKKYKLKLDI